MKRISVVGSIWLVLAVLVLSQFAGPAHTYGTVVPESPTPDDSGGENGSDSELASELPPPDFPTANLEGYTFDLRYALSAELDGVPKEAAVYELLRNEPTQQSVETIAENLEIDGDVKDQGDGSFTVSGNGNLFVTIDLVQYFSTEAVADGDLPIRRPGYRDCQGLAQNHITAPTRHRRRTGDRAYR